MRVAGGLQLAIQSPQSFQELILNLHSSFPVISCSLHGCNKSLYRPTTILLSPDSPSQIEMQHLLSLSMLNFHLNFFYAILLYSITMSKQAFDYDYLQMIKLCYLVIKKDAAAGYTSQTRLSGNWQSAPALSAPRLSPPSPCTLLILQ